MTIPVNVAYSTDSLWTKSEIFERLAFTQERLSQACDSIEIDLQFPEIIEISDAKLQDLEGKLDRHIVNQLNQIDSAFEIKRRPTLVYLRKANLNPEFTIHQHFAHALILEGPRHNPKLARLPWNSFPNLHFDPIPFVHGVLENTIIPKRLFAQNQSDAAWIKFASLRTN